MLSTSELVIERRRMRRGLAIWRILAIVAIVILVVVVAARVTGGGAAAVGGEHVARIFVDGIIMDDPDRDELLDEIAEDDAARALIVRINSPGGTVAGSEALYASLRNVAARKPVVAVMAEAAASGGYVTALGADHIVARHTTITGSIGVVAEAPNFAGLLQDLGIDVLKVKSAPLKAEPGILTEPAPGSIEAQQRLIDQSFIWFRDLVAERRGLEGDELEQVTDGRAFIGREAVDLGLIDAIGGEESARAWLAETREVAESLPVRDRRWDDPELPFPLSLLDDGTRMGTIGALVAERAPALYAVLR